MRTESAVSVADDTAEADKAKQEPRIHDSVRRVGFITCRLQSLLPQPLPVFRRLHHEPKSTLGVRLAQLWSLASSGARRETTRAPVILIDGVGRIASTVGFRLTRGQPSEYPWPA